MAGRRCAVDIIPARWNRAASRETDPAGRILHPADCVCICFGQCDYPRPATNQNVVIHNLDSFSFVTTREVYDPGQYVPYLGDPEIYEALKQIDPNIWKSKYIPLYGYAVNDMRFTWMFGLKGVLGLYPVEDYVQGYRPGYQRW